MRFHKMDPLLEGCFSFQAFINPRSNKTFFASFLFSIKKLKKGMVVASCPGIGLWKKNLVSTVMLPQCSIETVTIESFEVGRRSDMVGTKSVERS